MSPKIMVSSSMINVESSSSHHNYHTTSSNFIFPKKHIEINTNTRRTREERKRGKQPTSYANNITTIPEERYPLDPNINMFD